RDTVCRLIADIDPDGAEARFPGCRRQPKPRGHLTDTGIYYELHFDGHEKLNFKALRMGPVGIHWLNISSFSVKKLVKNVHYFSHFFTEIISEKLRMFSLLFHF
ncbi:hypothetical protein DFH09DRAFT_929830, partial [Mycena vulgaris]